MDNYSVDTDSGPVWEGKRGADSDWIEVSAEVKESGGRPRGKVERRLATGSETALAELVKEIVEDANDGSEDLEKMGLGFFVERMLIYIDEIMQSGMARRNFKSNLDYLEFGPLRTWRLQILRADPEAYDLFIKQPYEDAITRLRSEYRGNTDLTSVPDVVKMEQRKKKLREIHGYEIDSCLRCGKLKL